MREPSARGLMLVAVVAAVVAACGSRPTSSRPDLDAGHWAAAARDAESLKTILSLTADDTGKAPFADSRTARGQIATAADYLGAFLLDIDRDLAAGEYESATRIADGFDLLGPPWKQTIADLEARFGACPP